jgi:hypothetical protein
MRSLMTGCGKQKYDVPDRAEGKIGRLHGIIDYLFTSGERKPVENAVTKGFQK